MLVVLKDRDEQIRHDVELMAQNKGKTPKAREGEEVAARPSVAELLVRPLQDGHSMNVAVKIAEDDGSVTDYVVDTNSMEKPLRVELKHLQEVVVRVKVTNIIAYDHEQSAAVSVPLTPPPEGSTDPQHKAAAKDATHTARK